MIKKLKHRTNADRFENDVRASRPKWGRYFYLSLVAAFFLWIANLTIGSVIWLRADGLVTAEHVVLASPYEAQVVKMQVTPGQEVTKGQAIGEIHSAQVTTLLAQLTAQRADTVARAADLSIRLEVANAVINSAEDRLTQAEASVKKLTKARNLITDASFTNAVRERYTAMQERASREAERRSSEQQLSNLTEAQDDASAAIEDIRRRYNGGSVLAPADGVVGNAVAHQGDVVRPGEYLTELYTGQRYVLAYLSTGTLYSVRVGDKVNVADGFTSTRGKVTAILPITVQLPTEFQKAFSPTLRGQVARIELDDAKVFPLSAKVVVTGEQLLPVGSVELSYRTLASIQSWWSAARRHGQRIVEGARELWNALDR